MPRCAGFVRARFSSGWSPCARRALKGDAKQATANKKSDGRAQNTYFHSLV